jgi:hypothetical protein
VRVTPKAQTQGDSRRGLAPSDWGAGGCSVGPISSGTMAPLLLVMASGLGAARRRR